MAMHSLESCSIMTLTLLIIIRNQIPDFLSYSISLQTNEDIIRPLEVQGIPQLFSTEDGCNGMALCSFVALQLF